MPSIDAACPSLLPWNWGGAVAENPLPLVLKACRQGDLPALQALVAKTPVGDALLALVNTPSDGDLPLHMAVSKGHMSIAKFLIAQGAKPELKDGQELSAYDYAMLSSRPDTLMPELLACVIGQKVDVSMTVLQNPEKINQLNRICELVEEVSTRITLHSDMMLGYLPGHWQSMEIYHQDRAGNTLLHFAAAQGNEKLLRKALACGIDLNLVTNNDGQTPLHFACAMESPCIKLLVNEGKMDVSKSDVHGISPLALIGACTQRKHPLNISQTQALLATLIAADWVAQYALNPKAANYALWGVASLSQLATFAEFITVTAHWPLIVPISMVALFGIMEEKQSAKNTAAFFNIFLPFITLVSTAGVAKQAFDGIKKSWKNRSLSPLKAFRNVVVYGINLAHMSARVLSSLISTIDARYRFFKSKDLRQEKLWEEKKLAACLKAERDEFAACLKKESAKWFWEKDKWFWEKREPCIRSKDPCKHHKANIDNMDWKIDRIMKTSLFSGWSLWGPSAAKQAEANFSNLNPNNPSEARKILAPNGDFDEAKYSQNAKVYLGRLIRQLGLIHHPDKCGQARKEECTQIMTALIQARETLLKEAS